MNKRQLLQSSAKTQGSGQGGRGYWKILTLLQHFKLLDMTRLAVEQALSHSSMVKNSLWYFHLNSSHSRAFKTSVTLGAGMCSFEPSSSSFDGLSILLCSTLVNMAASSSFYSLSSILSLDCWVVCLSLPLPPLACLQVLLLDLVVFLELVEVAIEWSDFCDTSETVVSAFVCLKTAMLFLIQHYSHSLLSTRLL